MKERILLIDASLFMLHKGGKEKTVSLDRLHAVSEGMHLSVLKTTLEELKTIKEKNPGKKGRAADLALKIIDNMKIQVITPQENIIKKAKTNADNLSDLDYYDRILLLEAENRNTAVATTDLALKKKLREHGLSVIYLRGGKRFMMEK